MPVRRRNTIARHPDLAKPPIDLEYALLFGDHFFERPPLEMLVAAWDMHRDAIMERWTEDGRHGMRPFAMWLVELVPAHGERRVIDQRANDRRDKITYHGVLHTRSIPRFQEPEDEYLRRHNLLTAEERRMSLADLDAIDGSHFEWTRLWGNGGDF